MAIKTSGTLCASDIRNELGSSGQLCLGSSEARALAGKSSGQICFSDFYGKSAGVSTNYSLYKSIYPVEYDDIFFGEYVDTSDDKNTIVIASHGNDIEPVYDPIMGYGFSGPGSDGRTYIFTSSNSFSSNRKTLSYRDVPGNSLSPSDPNLWQNPFSLFAYAGRHAQISGDGTKIAWSAPTRDTTLDIKGGIWRFSGSGSSWSYTNKFPPTKSNDFANQYGVGGFAMSSDGSTLVTTQTLYAQWGAASRGAVHFWTLSGSTWTLQTSSSYALQLPAGSLNSDYVAGAAVAGTAISMTPDGSTVVVGEPSYPAANGGLSGGRILIFTRSGNTWTMRKEIRGSVVLGNFGFSTKISADGSTIVVGAPVLNYSVTSLGGFIGTPPDPKGKAYIYTGSGSSWNLVNTFSSSPGQNYDRFGYCVDITGKGEAVYVGAPSYYNYSTSEMNTSSFFFLANGGENGTNFTWDQGSVFIYTKSGNSYTFDKRLREIGKTTSGNRGTTQYAAYGHSLAVTPDGGQLVVGVVSLDIGGGSSGYFGVLPLDRSTQPVYVYRS